MKKGILQLVLLMILMVTHAAEALYFWDANGTAPGAGGPAPTGTWGVDPYWNDGKIFSDPPDPSGSQGTGETIAWSSGFSAVFAAGDDATGAYTVNVIDNLQVADIHVDLGQVTFAGGSINLKTWDGKGDNRLLSVGHKDPDCVARYNTPLTGATNIIRYKRGTLILGATNTFTGSITIEGGIIQLGAPHVLPSATTLILANNDTTRGDFNPVWQFTPAVFATGGFSQQMGTLQFAGGEPSVQRAIDFGNGASALSFANSSGEIWDGFVLTIENYTPGIDSLRFGTDSTGLTPAQLGAIQFSNFINLPVQIDSNGFVAPAIPVFLSVQRTSPSDVQLTWSAINGYNYRVQYKDDLNDLGWTDLTPDVFATGDTATLTDVTATTSKRFYQVVLLN